MDRKMPHSVAFALLLSLKAVDAFQSKIHSVPTTGSTTTRFEYKPTWKGDKGEPSYSDNFLLQFHNQAQNEKQLTTNSLAVWNEAEQEEHASIREWQECFLRNGLADFTPPMSFGLNCLMVGEDVNTDTVGGKVTTSTQGGHSEAPANTKLPWEEEPEADITFVEVVIPEKMSGELPGRTHNGIQTRLKTNQNKNAAATGLRVANKEAAVYDCIVDQGLLGAVLLTRENREEAVRELLLEASFALREHGIYVLNTKQ